MDNPELYVKVNSFPTHDTTETLKDLKHLLPWSPGENILDVGCGPGDVTTDVIASNLSGNFQVVGCDISEEMVKYAKLHYKNDKFCFKCIDISDLNIFEKLEKESFDKIVSFYCLHWVPNQLQAIKNMYKLLKNNGFLITLFTSFHPVFVLFHELKVNKKWKAYTKKWNNCWAAIYDSSRDSEEEFTEMLKKNGFKIIENISKEKIVINSREDFMSFFESLNPYMNEIPGEKKQEFLTDCKNILIEMGFLKTNENMEFVIQYRTLTTIAQKYENIVEN